VSLICTDCASEGPLLVAVIVNVRTIASPAPTVVTPSVLEIDRSAEVATVLESVAVLLAGVESVVVVLTVAEFTCGLVVVLAGTVYVALIVAEPPAAIVPREHVKLGPAPHEPCEGVTVPWLNPAGHVSLTDTDCASEGPLLLTVIVYVWVVPAPAVTVVTPSLFVIDVFAVLFTVSVSVAVLLPSVGSLAGELVMEAVLARLASE
jgi:hypothetical protein